MDLPDDLALPLDSGAPWWYWLGGRPALDFVNTRRERWWRDVETLVTPADLGLWLVRAELVSEVPPVTETLLHSARELREAIDDGVRAHLGARPLSQSAVATVDRWLPAAQRTPQLTLVDGGRAQLGRAPVADPGSHAVGLVARDAARMLGTGERERIRVCGSDTCSARFYDRSRSGGRRWCSMRTCGNVAKARRHRARARGEAVY